MIAIAAIAFVSVVVLPLAAVISYGRFSNGERKFEREVAAFWRDNS